MNSSFGKTIGAFPAVVVLAVTLTATAQEGGDASSIEALQSRLDAQAAEIRDLRDRLDRQDPMLGPSYPTSGAIESSKQKIERLPLVAEKPWDKKSSSGNFHTLYFYPDYDKGFVIRPFNPEQHPFELKLNGWAQFRHIGFARDMETWTDNAGVTRPVRNRNAFDIERARLVFSGFAVDERLTYFVHLDGDTDGRHSVDFFDYWWAWRFHEDFRVQMGKRKVPASRQWLLGARRTRFSDRPMANDFFRPDRTIGLFGQGSVGETGRYEAMVGNGYRSSNLPNSVTDNRFTFAFTNYFDPLGKFGGQIVDYDYSCDPLVRFGHSFVYSPQTEDSVGLPLGEADFLRLSDGTRLTQIGALAPGVTVSAFDIYFYGVDFAVKRLGWSVNAEVFWRWIEDIEGNGPVPHTDLMQRGFYVEGGRFLAPKVLDFNLRYSQVSGLFDNPSEWAVGLNWYPLEKASMKLSFDVSRFDGSPLQNTASDILVGDDGLLFRTQFQAEF